jgi:hypothetical protein
MSSVSYQMQSTKTLSFTTFYRRSQIATSLFSLSTISRSLLIAHKHYLGAGWPGEQTVEQLVHSAKGFSSGPQPHVALSTKAEALLQVAYL